MATYAERAAKLEQRYVQERARLDRELAILALIPPDLQGVEIMAHPHSLYDRIGSLHIKHCEYESLRKGPDPTPTDVLRFLAAFPPIDAAIYRDSFVGVRSLRNAYAELERAQSRRAVWHETSATITPIAPFWLAFEAASYARRLTIHWFTSTPIGIVEIQITSSVYGELARKIGEVQIRRSGNDRNQGHPSAIVSAVLVVTDPCRVIKDARAETLSFGNNDDRQEVGLRLLFYCSHNGEPSTIGLADLFTAAGIEVTQ